MKFFFKRNNSVKKNALGVLSVIIGLGITLHPYITGYDMLSGARNITEWVFSICFLMTGSYILIDWDRTLESILISDCEQYEEDDEDGEDDE